MNTTTATAFALIDNTTGQSWDGYQTEAQLKTAARLYAFAHPKSSLSVVVNGATHKIR
jgi:hypothetical protein